jgi:hypothetical protein
LATPTESTASCNRCIVIVIPDFSPIAYIFDSST